MAPAARRPRGDPVAPQAPKDSSTDLLRTQPKPETMASKILYDRVPVDFGDLFRSLPTKADLKALVADIKAEHAKDMQQLKRKIVDIQIKVQAANVVAEVVERPD